MSKLPLFLPALFCLAACAPVSVYYKPGETITRLKSDLLSCQVDALDKAPVANQIRQFPPYYVPGRRYCRSAGDCYVRGGFFAPGEIYSVDVNARLRGDLENQCMARRGYSPVAVPRCESGQTPVLSEDTAGASARIPTLSQDSCVVRNPAGDWQIIDTKG